MKVAQPGAEMHRASRALSDAGDIVASAPGSVDIQADCTAATRELGQVLRIASAYDELTDGDNTRGPSALDELKKSAGYDERVVGALESVLRTSAVD
jgi:hypothetical protein